MKVMTGSLQYMAGNALLWWKFRSHVLKQYLMLENALLWMRTHYYGQNCGQATGHVTDRQLGLQLNPVATLRIWT